jgi:hypothetical protein
MLMLVSVLLLVLLALLRLLSSPRRRLGGIDR